MAPVSPVDGDPKGAPTDEQYATALLYLTTVEHGPQLIALLRALDHLEPIWIGSTLRDGGRLGRVHAAYAELVRVLADHQADDS